jgi:hypothetical protein
VRPALAAALLALAGGARAEVVWDRVVAEVPADPAASETSAWFRCRNTGREPLRIISLESACGCTTSTCEQRELAPGASTAVLLTLAFGERGGHQDRAVDIGFSDGETAQLRIIADVPALFEVDQRYLRWRIGDCEPRVARIMVREPVTLGRFEVGPMAHFTTDVREIVPGRCYEVLVTPREVDQPRLEYLVIDTDHPVAARARLTLFATITP